MIARSTISVSPNCTLNSIIVIDSILQLDPCPKLLLCFSIDVECCL